MCIYIYKSIYVEPAEVCEKAVQWTSAVALFHLLKLEVTPDVITYNAVLSTCQKSAQWQRALDLFGEVHEQRIQPTIITCHLDGDRSSQLWPEIPVISTKKTPIYGMYKPICGMYNRIETYNHVFFW